MRTDDFDFQLPAGCIAQHPVTPRDAARLLVHDLAADRTRHLVVSDLARVLRAGDLLVVNDTRVLPARLMGRRASGGRVELLFVAPTGSSAAGDGPWSALVRPARRLRTGEELELVDGALSARLLARERQSDGSPSALWSVELFEPGAARRPVAELLEQHGRMPLPPYIGRDEQGDERDVLDRERYQTVYARSAGAVAAPTAGLHFTPELLAQLEHAGVERTAVTLHVGLGTFLPVATEDTREHTMHAERYTVSAGAADAIERCRARGGRVVAVGTTAVRALEAQAGEGGGLTPGAAQTRLFIEPGYRFRVVGALLTNFHLPRSTLLMLVSAFAGRERVLGLYREAIERGYRFYSYGDAMLLLRDAD